jgi:hypothetical protein
MKPIVIQFELTDAEAYTFAQFLKRVALSDYRPLAADRDEAETMLAAGEVIRAALRKVGYAPR